MINKLLTKFMFFLWIFLSSSTLHSQKSRKIEIYNNPFIFRGNVNNQFTSVNNKYVNGEYEMPYIFETGLNYVVQKGKWGWYAGLSFMMEQQIFSLELYTPADYYVYKPKYILQYNFDSYFIGYKAGVNYTITKKLQLNLGISFYDQIAPRYNFPYNKEDFSITYSYAQNAEPGTHPIEDNLKGVYNIKTYRSSYTLYLIPELRIDYEVCKNASLILGSRVKFWTGRLDNMFSIKVDGYFDQTNPEIETFHASKIKSQGMYTYIGIKYDIPIERWTSK